LRELEHRRRAAERPFAFTPKDLDRVDATPLGCYCDRDENHLIEEAKRDEGITRIGTITTRLTMAAPPAHEIAKEYPPIGEGKMTFEEYKEAYAESIKDPAAFWAKEARDRIDWFVPFKDECALGGGFEHGDVTWFAGGKLNVCYNAVDRHVTAGRGDQIAMVWEGDEPDDIRRITYLDLQRKISQIANALKSQGVEKYDVVTIYMPMTPELAMTMLACARLGAMHSVVFAGFSSEALAQRISAGRSKFLVTGDQGLRGGKGIALKAIVDEARTKLDCEHILEKVLVWERFYDKDTGPDDAPKYEMKPKDVRMDVLVAGQRPYSVPEWMDAEDNLFILYTSGSTGKPKGMVHTTGGYAVYAAFTTMTTFALEPDAGDLFACVADCGWITGHTYVVYGPLLCGSTTFLFESTPVYPDPGRYWDMVERHKITQFYTAPTAIRLLMRYGDEHPARYDTSSLKVLGSVGEPINPEAWRWYYEVVGKYKCSVVDTYWQTETGGHVVTNLPGITVRVCVFLSEMLYGIIRSGWLTRSAPHCRLTPSPAHEAWILYLGELRHRHGGAGPSHWGARHGTGREGLGPGSHGDPTAVARHRPDLSRRPRPIHENLPTGLQGLLLHGRLGRSGQGWVPLHHRAR